MITGETSRRKKMEYEPKKWKFLSNCYSFMQSKFFLLILFIFSHVQIIHKCKIEHPAPLVSKPAQQNPTKTHVHVNKNYWGINILSYLFFFCALVIDLMTSNKIPKVELRRNLGKFVGGWYLSIQLQLQNNSKHDNRNSIIFYGKY